MQKFWSILFGGTMLAALLLFIVSPFVSGWWLPRDISTFGGGIDRLFYLILAITGFFFVLTEAILVYAMFRYIARPGQKSSYVHGNHKLEVIWTLVPGVILFLLAVVQINVWAEVKFQKNMPAPDANTQQVEVMARQWEWRVRYPSAERMQSWKTNPKLAQDFASNPHLDDVHIPNEIHVWKGGKDPKDQHRVLVHLKTRDVLHSFFLPNLRLKQDALPGKTIPVWFAVTEHNTEPVVDPKTNEKHWVEINYDPTTGKVKDPNQPSMVWELACAEFCGARHSLMRGKLYVHRDEADFLDWLKHAEAAQNHH
ncbi:MAG TPA: cytochrome c oxidase subunit II [Gemmataceae bacterium]|nr:cytochrome c oxidase subunit II [Gemmataceae bacterium]